MTTCILPGYIVGCPEGDERLHKAAETFAQLLQAGAIKDDVPVIFDIFGLSRKAKQLLMIRS